LSLFFKFRTSIFIALFFCGSVLKSQQQKTISAEAKYFYGTGIGSIKGVQSNYTQGFTLGIEKKLNPESAEWINFLNAEHLSLNFIYTDMEGIQRDFTYGKSFGLISQIDFKLLGNDKFKLHLVPGIGVVYNTKTVFTNPETFIFGSHINSTFSAEISVECRIYKDWSVSSSVGLMHYSNGSVRIPNAGLNTFSVSFGIKKDFKIETSGKDSLAVSEIKLVKKNAFEFSAGAGVRGKYKEKSGFFKMGFYAGYSRYFNQTIGLRIGLDGVYYKDVYNPAVYEDTVPYWGKSWDHFRLGASFGPEIKMRNIAINAGFGRYLYFKSPYNQKFYWNSSIRYFITPNFGIQGTLNAHKFQADFVNWGLFCRI
jgi:hypothetical protein